MIDPGKITPLLNNMTLEGRISHRSGGDVYLISRNTDGKKLALKHISIPASQAETKALIYAGAVKNEAEAQRYYSAQVKERKDELLLLNGVKNAANLQKFRGYQVDQKYVGIGYDLYLLSDYCLNLTEYGAKKPFTKLRAVNLAIDLSSALMQLRAAGLIHRDVHPRNVFIGGNDHFMLGDLGLVKLEELRYSSMDDSLITEYTAPEVRPDSACLSENMDIYSVGVILYELYNGGELPGDMGGEGPLAAPAYADVAMSEIILKACASDPKARYDAPEDMYQALMNYLQRGDVSDELLVPGKEVPVQSVDDATVNISEIAATVAAGQAAERGEEAPAPEEGVGQEPQESLEAEAPKEEPKASLNDLKEDDLMVPNLEEMSVEDFMASLRGSAGLEVVSMDSDGNMTTVPGYETEETLPDDTEFMDSADDHFAVLKNLAEMEPTGSSDPDAYAEAGETTPQRVETEGSNLDISLEDLGGIDPELVGSLLSDPEEAPPVQPQEPRRTKQAVPKDDVNAYDDGYEEEEPYVDAEKGATWKKVLITVIVLLVLAGGATALYFLKTDTIRDMEPQVLSSTSVSILADVKNDTPMEVICSTATGEVARVPFTEAGATFTDLTPDTTYTFSFASTDGKLLLGSKTVTAKTKEMTNITGFAPTSLSAVSANLALGGVGPQPDKWIITLTSDDGQNITAESPDIPESGILVEGLTPETHYTAVVSAGDGGVLGGTTTCEFTTMAYTELTSFEKSDVTSESVSLTWAYTGTIPDSWTVTCESQDGDGHSETKEIVGTECVFDGLTKGVTYNFTLSAPSLKTTELSTMSIGIPAVTVTELSASVNEDGEVEVSWEYSGGEEPGSWRVSYGYAGETAEAPQTTTTETNSVVLKDLVPDTDYVIEVTEADGLSVECENPASVHTDQADAFTSYGCKDAEMTLYVKEENENDLETPSTEFTTEQHIAFKIQVSYDATEEDKVVTTRYVIRNSDGIPVQIYDGERNIRGTWTTAEHAGDLPDTITTPGSYTLEVYFDGDLLVSEDFTVS